MGIPKSKILSPPLPDGRLGGVGEGLVVVPAEHEGLQNHPAGEGGGGHGHRWTLSLETDWERKGNLSGNIWMDGSMRKPRRAAARKRKNCSSGSCPARRSLPAPPVEMRERGGGDFLAWLSPDASGCIFHRLDNPADLARAAAVSRSWRQFVIANEFCKSLCVRICPEVASFTRAVEVSESPPGPAALTSAESGHDAERDHRIYSYLGGVLVSTSPPADCIVRCIAASSTDRFPAERMENTLDPRARVDHRPSYWSSKGHHDPDVTESLTYGLQSDLCIIDEIRIQPDREYFADGLPVYSSKMARIRIGHSKPPPGSDEDENKMDADENAVFMYTSPEFPMLRDDVLQSFKLPCPVLCIGGVVKIELLGAIQKDIDDMYYICICHAKVIGRSLSPVFTVDTSDSTGHSILIKYVPHGSE